MESYDDLRNWRERRSIIRDGVDVRELASAGRPNPILEGSCLFDPASLKRYAEQNPQADNYQSK